MFRGALGVEVIFFFCSFVLIFRFVWLLGPSLESCNYQITWEERELELLLGRLGNIERYLAWRAALEGEPCDENLCCERTLHANGLYINCYLVAFAPSESFQSLNACL